MTDLLHAITLTHMALELGDTYRATLHPDGTTPESDTTHSIGLGWIAAEFARRMPGYDPLLCVAFASLHDSPELICGDVNTFGISTVDKAEKDRVEEEATAQLIAGLPPGSWFAETLRRYQAQIEPEARLVRFLDKITPKLTHALNGGATIKAMGKTLQQLMDAHTLQFAALKVEYPEFKGTPVADLYITARQAAETAYRDNPDRLRASGKSQSDPN